MADLYLKALESERRTLWATCRLKGLPSVSAERQRIADLDRQIAAHLAKKPAPKSANPVSRGKPRASAKE